MLTIEDRLAALERQNRRLRLLSTGTLLLLLAAAGMGAGSLMAVEPNIRANKFELVDPQGRTRAQLKMTNGQPVLVLKRANAANGVSLSLAGGHGTLAMTDTNNQPRLLMSSLSNGNQSSLKFFGPGTALPRVSLTSTENSSILVLAHPAFHATSYATESGAGVEAYSLGSLAAITQQVTADQNVELIMSDSEGVVFEAPMP